MFAKLVVVIAAMLLIGAGLLSLRQHRLNLMNQMARLHSDINRDRQAIWTDQARIAEHLDPQELTRAIEQAQLKLHPVKPAPLDRAKLVQQPNSDDTHRMIRHNGGG